MTSTEKTPTTYSSREVVQSLTGYDEAAIEKAFGRSVEDLAEHTGSTFMRALMFAVHRHDGMNDAQAHKAAMDLTFRELNDRFDQEEDDELPGSAAGKDDS